jgi:hypothetical protein
MAEGLLRHEAGDSFAVFSAGTKPTKVQPEAIAVMDEIGIYFFDRRYSLRLLIFAYATFFAALNAAQRFLVASEIVFRPAALIFRFGFAVTACVGSAACFSLAYLACCANAILRLTAALNFLRGFVVSGMAG